MPLSGQARRARRAESTETAVSGKAATRQGRSGVGARGLGGFRAAGGQRATAGFVDAGIAQRRAVVGSDDVMVGDDVSHGWGLVSCRDAGTGQSGHGVFARPRSYFTSRSADDRFVGEQRLSRPPTRRIPRPESTTTSTPAFTDTSTSQLSYRLAPAAAIAGFILGRSSMSTSTHVHKPMHRRHRAGVNFETRRAPYGSQVRFQALLHEPGSGETWATRLGL